MKKNKRTRQENALSRLEKQLPEYQYHYRKSGIERDILTLRQKLGKLTLFTCSICGYHRNITAQCFDCRPLF